MQTISTIDPTAVSGGLHQYAGQYVVIDAGGEVVGHGYTYPEAVAGVAIDRTDIAVFSVPVPDVVLTPVS